MNVYEKLQAIQTGMAVPKKKTNSFGGYSYRSREDIINAVKPFLQQYRLVLLVEDEMFETGGRCYVRSTATVKDCEGGPEDKISVSACAREPEQKKSFDPAQITRSSAAYAAKAALSGLFAIDDTINPPRKQEAREDPENAWPDENEVMRAATEKHYTRKDVNKVCRKSFGKKLEETNGQERAEIIARIKKA